MADLRLVGAVGIKVRPETSGFRRETQDGINDQLGRNGERVNAKATVKVDADTKAAEVKIDRFEKSVDGKEVKLNVGLDRESVNKAQDQIDRALKSLDNQVFSCGLDRPSLEKVKKQLDDLAKNAKVDVEFTEDKAGYQAALRKIDAIKRQKPKVTIQVDTDEKSLADRTREIQSKLNALRPAEMMMAFELNRISLDEADHEAENLKKKIDGMKASMQVEVAGSELVAAHLRFLGRDRVVNYIARVNTASIAAVEGVLKSVGGLNALESVGKTIEGLFTRFDTASLKIAGLATALGNLGNVGVYAGTAVFRIGEGVLDSLGLLAAAPAILGAATVGYTIFTAAFNNFFDAFNKDPKVAKQALEELPPIARKTVDSITGLYKGLANPIQEKFWKHVGSTLSDAIEHLYPDLKAGLLKSTEAVGDFVAGFGRSMTKLSLTDDIDKMFTNFNGFFKNLSRASEPFFDAWNKFGLQGSYLLPMFGDWVARMAVRFDDWATTLSANGGITDMIMHGVNSLQNMWQVGGSVIDIFKGITRAAGVAGTGGLAEFNVNLRKLADQMLGEPWQSRAATVFEGARAGASKLNGGFQDLIKTLGDSAEWLGDVLDVMGDIGGVSLTGLSLLFGNKTYQSGVLVELQGMKTLVQDLFPAFKDLGTIIGNMSVVAGAVFSDLGNVVSGITSLLAGVTTRLSDGLAAVAPKMLGTINGLVGAATPMVLGLADTISGVLDVAALVPNSFVMMGAAAAAYFALRGLSSQFYESLQGTKAFKNLEGQWLAQQAAAGKTRESYRLVNGEMQRMVVPTEKFNAFRQGWDDMRGNVDGMRTTFRNLNDQLINEKGTITLKQRMGKLDASGLQKIASSWTDLDKAGDAGENFWRGVWGNMKAANETASILKLSFADVTRVIADGGPEYERMQGNLDKLAGAMDALENHSSHLVNARENADEAAAAFGFTAEELQKMGIHAPDIQHLADNIRDEANAAKLSKAVFEGLATATGTSTVAAEQMAAAMKTIGDNSIDAAQKIGAINKALDLLKGGKLSAREAEAQSQQTFQSALQQAEAIRAELDKNNHLIDQTTGLIDITSTSGLKLQQIMTTSANDIKTSAQAAYDAARKQGDTVPQAMAKAQDIVDGGNKQLKAIADRAGVDVKTIQAEWDNLFGKDWELQATFSATAQQFQAVREEVEASGLKWDDSTFSAFLKANGDIANLTADEARKRATDFANGIYRAKLSAINPDALQKIAEAVGAGDAYKRGDYTALMKAINAAGPGAQAAWQTLMNVKGGPGGAGWAAAFKAFLDQASANATSAALNAIAAQKRQAVISVSYMDSGNAPGLAGGAKRPNANGSISNRFGGFVPGFRGPVQAFADGGISVENPSFAAIYKPAAQFRIFAEPQTGGEAFIPLSAAKRSRSTAILSEVARQFGYTLTSTQKYANGGIGGMAVANGAGGINLHIDAQPGLSYAYAQEVAAYAQQRLRDAQVLYDVN